MVRNFRPILCSECKQTVAVCEELFTFSEGQSTVLCQDCAASLCSLYGHVGLIEEVPGLCVVNKLENNENRRKAQLWRANVNSALYYLHNAALNAETAKAVDALKKKLDNSRDDDLLSDLIVGGSNAN